MAEIIGKDPSGAVEAHFVLVVFGGRYRSGEAVAGDDAAEVRWVAPEEFPALDLTADTARIVSRGEPL
jgi:ADP-ribose pyrophosphatase YjhB (NUDIX family)